MYNSKINLRFIFIISLKIGISMERLTQKPLGHHRSIRINKVNAYIMGTVKSRNKQASTTNCEPRNDLAIQGSDTNC